MAKNLDGANTPFRGKMGALTGYKRNGLYYERLSESVKNKSRTPAQIKQRSKFQVASQAFGPLAPIFKLGFKKSLRPGQNGYNAGMSYNMQSAVISTDEGFKVNWPAVKMSLGALPNVENIIIEQLSAQEIIIRWNPNSQCGIAQSNDRILIVLYDIEHMRPWAITQPDLIRASKEYCWEVPQSWIGATTMIYVFTYQESSECTSDSLYMGKFIL